MNFEMEILKVIDDPEKAARRCRLRAVQDPPYDGRHAPLYKLIHLDTKNGLVTQLLYSRDIGHHTSGWFKNPDYERCYHLSISFVYYSALNGELRPIPFEPKVAAKFVELVLRPWERFIWVETSKDPEAKKMEVRHYRVFCNEHWEPIIPRGEVYDTELTEKGWKSWSELHGQPIEKRLAKLEDPDK